MQEHGQVQGQNQGHGLSPLYIEIPDDRQGQGAGKNQGLGQGLGQGLLQVQGYGQGPVPNQGLGQGLAQVHDYGQTPVPNQGLRQGLLRMQGYGQGPVPNQGLEQDLAQIRNYGQGLGPNQWLGQGLVPNQGLEQGLLHMQGYGQGPVPNQGIGQRLVPNQGLGQGLLHMQGYGQGPVPNQGLGQGLLHMQGYGQGLVQNQGLGQGLMPNQGLGQGLLHMQCYGQGPVPNQGPGQGLLNMQGYGQGPVANQGLGQGLLPNQGLGQGLLHIQGYGQGLLPNQGLGLGLVPNQGLGRGLLHMQGYGQGPVPNQGLGQALVPNPLLGQGLLQIQSYGQGLVTNQGLDQINNYGQGPVQNQGISQWLLHMQGYGPVPDQIQNYRQGMDQIQNYGQGPVPNQGLGQRPVQNQRLGQGMEPVMVDVAQGTLRGRKVFSKAGIPYYNFQGIPYAKPPVGFLRFKDPEPPEPWFGVRDALQDGPYCIQHDYLQGSEDCLYLNVFTPQIPKIRSKKPLMPVMLYIHCCGYVSGTGNKVSCGPDYLVDEGVVMVTINYRLGVLGFLCLDIVEAPGNVGLKDQVAAMRWVQQNITAFGGAPSNVTIFGCGSGGASVTLHMLSPMSKGLFHKAMSHSGTALNPWGWEARPRETAFRMGAVLRYFTEDPLELVKFLRGVEASKLVTVGTDGALSERNKNRFLAFPFVPTPEVDLKGVERFLPGTPLKLLEAGHYHAVPYMTGVTSREGLIVLKFLKDIMWEALPQIKWNFDIFVLPELRIPEDCLTKGEILDSLRNFYMICPCLSMENMDGFIDMYSDLLFGEGVHTTVKIMAEFAKAPLYYFCFSYEGRLGILKTSIGLKYRGVCHADMFGYLFRVTGYDLDLDPESPDAITRARVVKMWTNFAKTGNPTPEVTPLLPVTWPQHTAANPCYLNIDRELSVGNKFRKERMELFERIYRNL